jgi:hypothetical protein
LTGIEERLTRALYRMDCPDPTELGEYHLQMVSGDRAKFIKQHLVECPLCRREAAQLQNYLAGLAADLEPRPLERIRDRLKVVVARLLDSASASGLSGPRALAPAYAGLRGAEEGPLIYQAGELQVVIQVHEDANRPGRQTIVGLVTGLSDPQTVTVHLWQAGQQLLTGPVDDLGNFEISDLAPAGYELILSGPETEIHIQDLPVSPG